MIEEEKGVYFIRRGVEVQAINIYLSTEDHFLIEFFQFGKKKSFRFNKTDCKTVKRKNRSIVRSLFTFGNLLFAILRLKENGEVRKSSFYSGIFRVNSSGIILNDNAMLMVEMVEFRGTEKREKVFSLEIKNDRVEMSKLYDLLKEATELETMMEKEIKNDSRR